MDKGEVHAHARSEQREGRAGLTRGEGGGMPRQQQKDLAQQEGRRCRGASQPHPQPG